MLDRILLPIDLTDISKFGIETGKEFAKRFNSKLHLLYVLKPLRDILPELFQEEFQAILSIKDKLKEEAIHTLAGYTSELFRQGIEASYSVVEGDEVESILDFSKESMSDLIVMPSHRKTNVEIKAVGSVSLRVSSKANTSVLVVKQKPLMHIDRILVNYDFLPSSIRALEKAIAIARKFGSKLLVLHVDHEEHQTHLKSIYNTVLEKKKNLLEDIKNQHKDIDVETLLLKGNPKEEVLKVINRGAYDLVVMGRRNPIDKSRVFLGSLALEVIKNSPVSVLISRGD